MSEGTKMSEINKFKVKIIVRDQTESYSHDTSQFVMGTSDLTLLMNSYLNADEWICIEDLEKSKKTKKKVGWAALRKDIVNIDIFPVLPKSKPEDDND